MDDKIQGLWNQVAEVLARELGKEDVSPHMVQAAIRFLKDNEIEQLPATSKEMDTIFKSLPFPKFGKAGTG